MLNIFTNFDPYILYIYTFWSLHIIFESLPISSSGHLKLLAQLFSNFTKTSFAKVNFNNLSSKKYIQYIMHIPNLFIILLFLALHNIKLFLDFRLILKLFILVFTANLFTGFFYFLFNNKFKFLKKLPLYFGFSITALLLLSLYFKYSIYFHTYNNLDFENISLYRTIIAAIIIGTVQGISLLPGISRLASTCTAGIWLSFTPFAALTLSLLVQAPLILAALLKESKSIISNNSSDLVWLKFLNDPKFLSIILFASFISYQLILLILFMLQKKLIWVFGIYMLIPILLSYYSHKNSKYSKSN